MNKLFIGENKILLVNNVEELTIPKISVFLFVHDIIAKENFKTVSKVIQRKIDKVSNSIYVIIIL